MLLRALFIALLTSVYSWAGVISAEGLHQWSAEPSGCTSVDVSLTALTPATGLNRSGVVIDPKGVIYFGNPLARWEQGITPSSIGVDFLSAFGESVSPIAGESKLKGCGNSLYLSKFRFNAPELLEDTISARFTWLTPSSLQIDYYIHHNVDLEDIELVDLPGDVIAYRNGVNVVVGSFKEISSKALVGRDWNITPTRVGNGYSYIFDPTKQYGSVEIANSLDLGRNVLRIHSTPQDLVEGEVWPLGRPDWLNNTDSNGDLLPVLWRDFGTFRVVYKINMMPGEQWKIWFAEEGAKDSDELPFLPASTGWTSFERPVADFGKNLTLFSPTATSWQELEVGPLKIMTLQPNGGSIEIDSIILTKSQPSSFQIIDTKDEEPVVKHTLTVRLVGEQVASKQVTVSKGDSTGALTTDSEGKAVFTLPSGTWTVKPVAVDRVTFEPESQTINLTANQEVLFQSEVGKPSLHGDTIFSVSEGDTASWLLDEYLSTNDENIGPWLATWSIKWGTGAKLPVQIDPAIRRLKIGQVGSILNGTGRYLIRATLPNGLFVQESLTVVVRPVNQRPQIHAVRWTVPVNGVLAVSVDTSK